VGRHRLTRPVRARFARGVVTDREDEVEVKIIGSRELVPTLAPQFLGREPQLPQQSKCDRMDLTLGVTAGTEAAELALAELVDYGFSEDAARGIARAQKQNTVDLIRHLNFTVGLLKGGVRVITVRARLSCDPSRRRRTKSAEPR